MQNHGKKLPKRPVHQELRAKFVQNPLLLEFLRTTKPLKLAEGTYNRLLGNRPILKQQRFSKTIKTA